MPEAYKIMIVCISPQKKKQPIPIRLTGKDIPGQVRKACSCTYMFKNSGTSINIKVRRTVGMPMSMLTCMLLMLMRWCLLCTALGRWDSAASASCTWWRMFTQVRVATLADVC